MNLAGRADRTPLHRDVDGGGRDKLNSLLNLFFT